MDNEVAAGAKNNASNGGRACKIGKPSGHSIFRRCVSLETFIIRLVTLMMTHIIFNLFIEYIIQVLEIDQLRKRFDIIHWLQRVC